MQPGWNATCLLSDDCAKPCKWVKLNSNNTLEYNATRLYGVSTMNKQTKAEAAPAQAGSTYTGPVAHCSPEIAAAFGLDKLARVAPHLVKIDLPNAPKLKTCAVLRAQDFGGGR